MANLIKLNKNNKDDSTGGGQRTEKRTEERNEEVKDK